MSKGIGAYYSPAQFRQVPPPPSSGVGAYYSPAPLRPVEGWDSLDPNTKSFLAIVGLLAFGYFFLRRSA
jgi:hypothetical protein